jgi:hypothetical protein
MQLIYLEILKNYFFVQVFYLLQWNVCNHMNGNKFKLNIK